MSIAEFVSEYVTWAAEDPRFRYIETTFASQSHGGIVGFGRGGLSYRTESAGGGPMLPEWKRAVLQGTFDVLFSDRIHSVPGSTASHQAPFNPNAGDQMHISLDLGLPAAVPIGGATLKMTLTLMSWGYSRVTFPVEYTDGVLFGLISDWRTLFAFGFKGKVSTRIY